MSEFEKDRIAFTDMDRLANEAMTKVSALLRQDGKQVELTDLGPSLYVEYLLDPPQSMGNTQIYRHSEEVDARLVLLQKANREGPFGRITATLRIFEGFNETSRFTFVFKEGFTPKIKYRGAPRYFSGQANETQLSDLLQLLDKPLFLVDIPK